MSRMKCEKVTIEVFMNAWFNEDFDEISKEDFGIVYAEYIDLSGLYQSKEFELFAYTEYLKNRIYTLETIIYSQGIYYEVFKQPYKKGIELLTEEFGLNFEWREKPEEFFYLLKKLKNMVRTKNTELKRKRFEFDELKKKKEENDVSQVQNRHEFIKMLNSFNKNGYKIDRKQTTVEELALMIKQSHDEYEEFKANNLKLK